MMTRGTILRFALLGGLSFMLGFAYRYHLPKIESFLLVEIERVSKENSPVRVWAESLSFHLVPLGVTLENVHLLPQSPLDKVLAPAILREAGARLALLPLLRGEVRLSQVYIHNSEFNVFLKSEMFEGKKGPSTFKIDFDAIYRLPIDEISLEGVQIQGKLMPQNVVFRISELNLNVENRYQSIFVEISAPRVLIKPSGPVHPLNAQLELRTLVEADEIQVSAFKLKADESFVVASGHFNGDIARGHLENGAFDTRSKLNLSDINVWESVFFLKPKVPKVLGHAELDLAMEVRKGKGFKVEGDLNVRGAAIDKFIIGDVKGHAASDLKLITSDGLTVQNSAGKIEISKLNLRLEPHPAGTLNLKLTDVEVHQLLENLDVHHVPILVPLNGQADCSFSLGENPEASCSGGITSPKVHVDTGRPKFSVIAEAHDLKAKGEAHVDSHQVSYKADLWIGKNSTGKSDGIINYDKGFKINYKADNLAFADVKNLVNLKLEGEIKCEGSTTGTSKWATIDMGVEGKNLWLEDYPLGSATTKLNYRSGILTFTPIQGQYEVSRYSGLVALDLNKDRIRINGQIPFMDLKDLQAMFRRKITLPVQWSGTGTGKVDAEGPLRFSEMSYTMQSNFYRGQIAGETFDEFTFNVRSVNGLVKNEKILLTKASGQVEVRGQITPKGEIDTVAVGRGLRLEQSENLLQMGLDLQGLADFSVLVHGQLPKPRVELNGRLSKVVLADQPAQDSVFKLNFLPDRLDGSGQFLGSTLQADFTFPFETSAPFSFKLKARKWDFTSLFSVVSKSARQIDFTTLVSMDVNLQSAQGGFWNSSGRVEIDEFKVRKGGKQLAAEKPMYLAFKNGVINSENFTITSGDSYLKLDVSGLKKDNLNASLNGKVDLSLLGLFTPFISDLRGNMALSMDLKGNAEHPYVSGSAYIDKGYAKFAEFTHPFSNVRADVLFNDNEVLLNAVRADLAGGKVSGEGKVTFAGKSRPIDVRGTFSDVKLNVPDGFHSQGSGTVAIHGDSFPYNMDINYDVTGGEIVSEFAGQGGGSSVKASIFLPKFLDQDGFHPFNFLLDVNLKNSVSVNNSLMLSPVSGHVRANGTPDQLRLTGSFTPAAGGKVFFRDTPFEIGSGFIEYNNTPPADPKIYLTASARVTDNSVDDQGRSSQNQYDVNMLVQGRGQDPQLSFTSQPPLAQREIVSLLALGVTGAGMDDRKGNDQLQAGQATAAVSAALLQKAGGKRVKDTFGIDVKLSSSQSTTTENASQPKVTLSKQWTPKLGASASSTLESNPNNNVKVEYKVNKSVSVIGSWDGRETLKDQQSDTTKNVFGLDLQYKVPFK